jgi:hypothetical protein
MQNEFANLDRPQEFAIAIRYIMRDETEFLNKWDLFWRYFLKTWTQKYETKLWNIHHLDGDDINGRTNNALERYNRRLGEKFAVGHPSLQTFVQIIQKEVFYFSEILKNKRNGIESISPGHQEWDKPNIPDSYLLFKATSK